MIITEETRKKWVMFAQLFGQTGEQFVGSDLPVEVYEKAVHGYDKEAIKNAISDLYANCPTKLPTANQIREKLTGVSSDSRKRASEGAERIWNAIGACGWNQPESARKGLSDEEWEVVRLRGGWEAVCDVTYAQQNAFMAQVRELLVTLYERTAAGHPARLEQLTSAQHDLLQLTQHEENGEDI
jgi:hypothetical protein